MMTLIDRSGLVNICGIDYTKSFYIGSGWRELHDMNEKMPGVGVFSRVERDCLTLTELLRQHFVTENDDS